MIQRREVLIAYISVAACAAIFGCRAPQPTAPKFISAPNGPVLEQYTWDGNDFVPTYQIRPLPRMYEQLDGGCSVLDYAWQAPECKGSI